MFKSTLNKQCKYKRYWKYNGILPGISTSHSSRTASSLYPEGKGMWVLLLYTVTNRPMAEQGYDVLCTSGLLPFCWKHIVPFLKYDVFETKIENPTSLAAAECDGQFPPKTSHLQVELNAVCVCGSQ